MLVGGLFYICTILAFFFVRISIFLVPLWLPRAHAEAPVSNFMVLADVLLRLGG